MLAIAKIPHSSQVDFMQVLGLLHISRAMIKLTPLQPAILFGFALLCIAESLTVQSAVGQDIERPIDFAKEVRPILAGHCWSCHGPDENSREADLRLDRRDNAIATAAIVPFDPSASALVERILSDDPSDQMPPPSTKKPLTDQQKAVLQKWILQGAEYKEHWAFAAPVTPTLPALVDESWGNHPIDRFIHNRLTQENLNPSPKADRATLLRRVSLDLTGLPPTVGELQQFLNDPSNDAYERAVDRLLGSKSYAERMALEWLDLSRYADTNGYNNDEDRTMWPWRDWVINAFDRNMPFDQFVVEQLAGDLLPNPTLDQLIATGFLRNQGHNTEGGIIQEEYRVEYVADRVHTVATVFLGLSLQCARCHDHKFDPISQAEYYQFYSFFNSLDEKQAGYSNFVGAEPFVRVPNAEQAAQIKDLASSIATLESKIQSIEAEVESSLALFLTETSEADLKRKYGPNLLHHFSFDKTQQNTLIDSVTGASTIGPESTTGVSTGTIKWQEGKSLEAVELDEQTRIELPGLGGFTSDQPFTISVWVKPASNDTMAILSKMDETQNFRGYDLLLNGGKVEMHLVHQWPNNAIKISTKQPIAANQWHHIVASYDGSKKAAGLRIYVDSKSEPYDVAQDSLRDTIETSMPFRIGLRQTSLPFRGLVDELKIFGTALYELNVQQLFALQAMTGFIDWIQVPVEQRTEEQRKQLAQFYLNRIHGSYADQQKQLAEWKQQKTNVENSSPAVMVLREMSPARETFVLKRGQYDQPGERVFSSVPAVLAQPTKEAPRDRLTLARWLTDPSNPLTARVTVNRWWQHFFGTGIVKSAEDFGLTGDTPTHPELLDFLACSFVENGWDVKAFQKMIVMSEAYQQESRVTLTLQERDPENKLLARGSRLRLSAETIRDNSLAISGLLQNRIGGPSVKPYQPEGLWEDVTVERRGKYVPDIGEGRYRRSLYTFWKRTCPPPSMMNFDAPNREVCIARRARTNTPLQALVLLNDPTYIEAARLLAQKMIQDAGPNSEARIDLGFQRCVARTATSEEKAILIPILDDAKQRFNANPKDATLLNSTGPFAADPAIDPIELASWTVVASTLLNLDETISKR